MRLLIVATKAPWPPVDGGRLLLGTTLRALAAEGVRATLVAPADPRSFDLAAVAAALAPWCEPRLVPARPLPGLAALARSGLAGLPLSIARHALAPVEREVERLLAAERFDLVHAEQLQALPQARPAARRGLPVVLRAQNVESDLWAAAARSAPARLGGLARFEARRLAHFEGRAVAGARAVFALSAEDAARLAELGGGRGRLAVVPAPFPAALAPGTRRLPGEPAVVVLGSRGWRPNAEAAARFAREVWPEVLEALPGARLHLFGSSADGRAIESHPPPVDSADAFPPGAIQAVPVTIASGVRMKILEAWARGVPVVGTPEAVAGLTARDGEELLVARDGVTFAAAIARLHREAGLAERLVAAGRRALAERHDPRAIARRLLAGYEEVVTSAR